jgi:hypothetical protein
MESSDSIHKCMPGTRYHSKDDMPAENSDNNNGTLEWDSLKRTKDERKLSKKHTHEGLEIDVNINNEQPKETDHEDKMQLSPGKNKKSGKGGLKVKEESKQESDYAPRTVSVVEHNNGFKSHDLNKKLSGQLNTGGNRIERKTTGANGNMISGSEKSKRLSPDSSQGKGNPNSSIHAFDYMGLSNRAKIQVTFKEEEYGEDEGGISPTNEPLKPISVIDGTSDNHSVSKYKFNSNPNRKITTILKNSKKDINYESNENSDKKIARYDYSIDQDSNSSQVRLSHDTTRRLKNKEVIANMRVEEDQVNLSDLGNGPDKPVIKTIYKKVMKHRVNGGSESTYSKASPGKGTSSKANTSKINSPRSKRKGSPNKMISKDYTSDNISEYSEVLDDPQYLEYKMISNLFLFADLIKDDHFKVKQYSDALYRGIINPKNNMREGKGIMEYNNGRVYEGNWVNDLRNGTGYEKYANGNFYSGEFSNGKAHGKGYYKWANGEFYNGNWNQGQKDGYGEWKSREGETYNGTWKEGVANGVG